MKRTILQQADLSGVALNDLKDWLGIQRPDEDAMLTDLLHASVAACEAFIRQAPLEQVVEERVSPQAGDTQLSSRPIQSFVLAELVTENGERITLDENGLRFVIDAAGNATLTVLLPREGRYIGVRFIAGLATDWTTLQSPLKQGIIRLAAHHYRDRDRDTVAERASPPPASVTALWQPWRRMSLR